MGVTPAQWRKMQEPSVQDVLAKPAISGAAIRAGDGEMPGAAIKGG
jgi:hypothetical protein